MALELCVLYRFQDLFESRPGLVSNIDEIVSSYQRCRTNLGWRRLGQFLPGEIVKIEFAVAGGAVHAMQFQVLVEAWQAEETLQRRILHLWRIGETHVIADEREHLR